MGWSGCTFTLWWVLACFCQIYGPKKVLWKDRIANDKLSYVEKFIGWLETFVRRRLRQKISKFETFFQDSYHQFYLDEGRIALFNIDPSIKIFEFLLIIFRFKANCSLNSHRKISAKHCKISRAVFRPSQQSMSPVKAARPYSDSHIVAFWCGAFTVKIKEA